MGTVDFKQLLLSLIDQGVTLDVDKDKLIVKGNIKGLDNHTKTLIKDNKEQIISYINQRQRSAASVIQQRQPDAKIPLSFAQQRLWFIEQLEPGTAQFNVPLALTLKGIVNFAALQQTLDEIVIRHQILRTSYVVDEHGEASQSVNPPSTVALEKIDISDLPSEQHRDKVTQLCELEAQKPFDLTLGVMFRASIIVQSEGHYVLLFTMHHICSDGWSMGVLTKEFVSLYDAFSQQLASPLAPLSIQYGDYALWQRQWLQGDFLQQQVDYWRDRLAGIAKIHSIALDKKRPDHASFSGAKLTYEFDKSSIQPLNDLSRASDSTLFMTLQSAFAVLLSRYANDTDVVIGTPVANRPQAQLAPLIGFFLNSLVLRNDLSGNPSFKELLQRVKQTTLEAFDHQHVPFEMLVEELQPERALNHAPLFQVQFTLQNNENVELSMAGVKAQMLVSDKINAKYDLTLTVVESEETVFATWEYCTDLFVHNTIARMAENFATLLQSIIANPDCAINQLNLISDKEQQQLLVDFNASQRAYDNTLCIHEFFEQQASQQGDKTALVFESQQLTYAELNVKANQLAHHLVALGVKPGAQVGLCIERSIEMVVGLLAILKAGGAYVPMDPSYPVERLQYMLEDAGAQILLTQQDVLGMLSFTQDVQVLCVDRQGPWSEAATSNIDKGAIGLSSSDMAYMIYTSGSTGKPKGVMIEHRNVANFFAALDDKIGVAPNKQQHWLAVTSISFDISVLELFWTLSNGNKVIVQPDRPVPVAQTTSMDFSLFYFAAEEANASNKYRLLLEGAKFADEHGMSAVWVPERHFASFGDQFPNPSVAAAAVAATTKNVTIRSGSVVLPLHDPIRVAEEWSMVDNLSEGRVQLSMASGWHPNDFVFFPDDYQNRHQKLRDSLEQVQTLWQKGSVKRTNGLGEEIDISIRPHPVQETLPIWFTAAGSPETFRYAGSIGANLLTHLLGQSKEELAEKITIYRDALEKAGFARDHGKVALMLHTFVGEDGDKVKDIVEQPFKNYLRHSINLLKPLIAGTDLDINKDLEAILDIAFQRYYEHSALLGTPQSCMAQVEELQGHGVDEIACLIDFGVDHQLTLDNLPFLHQLQQSVKHQTAQQQLLAKRLDKTWSPETLIAEHDITHMQCTPSFAREMSHGENVADGLGRLEKLLVGGEALTPELANALLAHVDGSIYNMYGPTETTVWSAISQVVDDKVHLGAPIANTQFYVVDKHNRLVPQGAIGELYIGGDGVTRGYFERDALTKERFIANPFAKDVNDPDIVYRTGDLVRWLDNGTLLCLGRIDHQVKVRGFRIELGEIESALMSHSWINEAVVIARGEPTQLIAYMVATSDIKLGQADLVDIVKEHIKTRLPEYMLPAAMMVLDAMPLTPNGKVDRKALPEHGAETTVSSAKYVAPSTVIEQKLCDIWQSVLGVAKVGVTDNFFNIGGDSILSIRLIARCNQEGLVLSTRQLFEHQTVREIALQVGKEVKSITPQEPMTGAQVLLPIQQWYLTRGDEVDLSHYNHSLLLQVPDDFNAEQLTRLITALYQRHDVLRLRFSHDNNSWVANYADPSDDSVNEMVAQTITLEDISAFADPLQGLNERGTAVQASLNIENGPIFRAALFTGGTIGKRLLLALHHLVVDGISWRVLLTDIQNAYQQMSNNANKIVLAPKTSSLQQWGEFLQTYATGEHISKERDYWVNKLSIDVPALPQGREHSDNTVATNQRLSFELDDKYTKDLLTNCNQTYHTEINDLLLSALFIGVNQWTGGNAIAIDLESHGREFLTETIDHSDTIGWFTSMYPLVLEADVDHGLAELIMAVKEQIRAVPGNGLGFGLLRYVAKDPELVALHQQNAAPIIFNYLGQVDQALVAADASNQSKDKTAIRVAEEEAGVMISKARQREHQLVVTGAIAGGKLALNLGFNGQQYDDLVISELANHIQQGLEQIIDHCQSDGVGSFTPSDFPLVAVEQQQLQQWQQDYPQLHDLFASTPMQQGLLFHSLIDQSAYATQLDLTLVGKLDLAAFKQAWQQVIDHHDIFRTAFVGEQMHQLVVGEAQLVWHYQDLRDLEATQHSQAFEDYRQQDKARGFDIAQVPLVRVAILQLANEQSRLLITYHHALMDAWSQAIIIKDAMSCYQAIVAGKTPELAPLVPYRSYIQWLQNQDHNKARQFWHDGLGEIQAPTQIGIDEIILASGEHSTEHGPRETRISLDESLTAQLLQLAKAAKTTMNIVVHGAWSYLLHRYSGDQTVVFGETSAGRPAGLTDVEQIVGLFINTLPVRIDIKPQDNINAWLQQIHKQSVEREQYSYLSLLEIQQLSGHNCDGSLFDTLVAFNNIQMQDAVKGELKKAPQDNQLSIENFQGDEQTNYGLTLSITLNNTLNFSLGYRAEQFTPATINQLLGHLEQILTTMAKDGVKTVEQLDWLSAEQRQLLAAKEQVIVDSQNRIQPIGVAGFICAKDNSELDGNGTAIEIAGTKSTVYKSDRIGCLSDNGELIELGDAAQQVRVAGFKVNLDKVTQTIKTNEVINDAIAVVDRDSQQLVAYVTSTDEAAKDEKAFVVKLQQWLNMHLPSHMLPTGFRVVDQIDINQLPAPILLGQLQFEAPIDQTEIELVKIWQELLDVDKISRFDNFFAIGGNSLSSIRLEFAINMQFEVEVSVRELFEHGELASQAQLIKDLIHNKHAGDSDDKSAAPPLVAVSRVEQMPLSFAQQRLWFIDQLKGSAHYNIPHLLQVEGNFDVNAFEQAIIAMIQRHEVLRTCFAQQQGDAYQVILAQFDFALAQHDFSDLSAEQQQQQIDLLTEKDVQTPFDLSADVMLKASVFKLSLDLHVILITVHHIAFDGWSLGIFTQELGALYNGIKDNNSQPLPPLALQYADFATWQRNWLKDEVLAAKLDHWKQYLAGIPPLHSLPTDKTRPAVQTYNGTLYQHQIEAPLARQINQLCQQYDVTLFMLLQTAFNIMLSRYSNETDIVCGTPIAGRGQSQTVDMIGFFVNTLVLRNDLSGNPKFTELLARNKQNILDAYTHQDIPFEMLVDELNPERNFAHGALYQIVFAVQNFEPGKMEMADSQLKPYQSDETQVSPDYELGLHVIETETEMLFNFSCNTDVFFHSSLVRFANSLTTLLHSIVADATAPIQSLEMLTAEEKQTLLVDWNNTSRDYPTDACIHQLFEAQAAKTPDNIALDFDGETLTYEALNQQANQLAHHLISREIEPDEPVGLCTDRSIALIVGMLGILKAGAAYVPIDPSYPEERIDYIIEDSEIELVVTQSEIMSEVDFDDLQVLPIDGVMRTHLLGKLSTENPEDVEHSPEQMAYIIYTSGSTGKPKGVIVTNQNVVALVSDNEYLTIGENDVMGQVSNMAFDAITFEVWAALCHGAKLTYIDKETLLEPSELEQRLKAEAVTVAFITAALLNQVAHVRPNCFASMRYLLVGGDKVDPNSVQLIIDNGKPKQLINGYGPTETTTFAVTGPIDGNYTDTGRILAIGRPMNNTKAYVLSGQGDMLPIGAIGELCIGGDGVARGYLNQDQLTAQSFVADPFSDKPNARLYKTGDLVRWLDDGTIECIGRVDNQVKIRGFRIELGEIEQQLMAMDKVNEAVVVAFDDGTSKRLVAYVVLQPCADQGGDQSKQSDIGQMRAFLQQKFPEHMIPAAFEIIEKLPLTANGKVDRRALPEPSMQSVELTAYVEPTNEIETNLREIWQQVLKLERVGINDNFFSLGGDSILSIRIVSKAKELGYQISVKDIFNHQNIGALAKFILDRNLIGGEEIKLEPFALLTQDELSALGDNYPERLDDAYPMSELQQGMVFHSQLGEQQGSEGLYHDIFSYHIKLFWDIEAFEQALSFMFEQHPVLRSGYILGGERPIQQVYKHIKLPLEVGDVCDLDEDAQEAYFAEWIKAQKNQGFDWNGPLFKVFMCRRSDNSFQFSLSFHHAVYDGWSNSTFISQLMLMYQGINKGEALPEKFHDTVFRDFIAKEQQVLADPKAQSYWVEMLENAPMTQIPRKANPGQTNSEKQGLGEIIAHKVNDFTPQSGKVIELAKNLGVPLQSLLLAVHAKVLTMVSGQNTALTSVVVNGRPETEMGDKGLGLFLNSLPICFSMAGNSWADIINDAATTMADSMQYRNYPLSAVQRNTGREFSEVIFNYTHFHAYEALSDNSAAQFLGGQGVEQTNFDYNINFSRTVGADDLSLLITYGENVYSADTIERIGQYFVNVFAALIDDVAADHRGCWLTAEEQQILFTQWNKPVAAIEYQPAINSMAELFEHCAKKWAERTALVHGQVKLTYQQVNQQANQLAHYIRAQGVTNETRVGLCIERGINAIVSMLAIMKSGGAYVPIDPNYPQTRIDYIIKDADIDVVITQQALVETLSPNGCAAQLKIVCLDDPQTHGAIISEPNSNIGVHNLSQLAYMIYTSGSTGLPKGVMIEHLGLCNLAIEQSKAFNIDAQSKVLQFASISFDASVSEWATTFAVGAELHLSDDLTLRSPPELGQLVHSSQISHVTLPPLLLSQLDIEQFTSVQHLIVAGEACPLESARKWSQDRYFYNAYGPSEGTVCATIGGYDPQRDRLHIGKPMNNVQALVLDSANQLAPIGTVGELCIGGLGLARGYLGKEQLTNERFITSALVDGQRLYKTGDLARYTADGDLIFVGRVDNQVKVRGYRIELGEIEYQLTQVEDVKDAVVIATDQGQTGKRLVAYVATDKHSDDHNQTNQSIDAYRQALSAKLPDYMVPSVFVMLNTLPMTSNGKVDHKALPDPDSAAMQRAQFIAPRNETEQQLAAIWQQLLGLDSISVNDNFYLLGGHSLLAMKLQGKINQQFDTDINLYQLVSNVTLASQAQLIANQGDGEISAIVELRAGENQLPIYMVPGLAGHGHIFHELAGQLNSTQNIYAFNPQGIDGNGAPHQSAEEAAQYYAAQMIKHSDVERCVLLGYSLGASVACEMSKILQNQGYQVPLLIVLDGYGEYQNINEQIELADISTKPELGPVADLVQAQSKWRYNLGGEKLDKIVTIQSSDCTIELAKQWQVQAKEDIAHLKVEATHEQVLKLPQAQIVGDFVNQHITQLTNEGQ